MIAVWRNDDAAAAAAADNDDDDDIVMHGLSDRTLTVYTVLMCMDISLPGVPCVI